MIHTYRDPETLSTRFFGPLYVSFLLFVPIFLFGQFALGWFPFTSGTALVPVLGTAFLFAHQYFVYRSQHSGSCGEIRLSDDGTCELETKRRVIRLHVNEIRSVQFLPEDDESSESYTICYQGGKLRVTRRMTGFPDFLSRVKTLNPAVDLTSFPADTWPDLGAPATEGHGTYASRFIHSALFPLTVIALLVYLASQTIVGK